MKKICMIVLLPLVVASSNARPADRLFNDLITAGNVAIDLAASLVWTTLFPDKTKIDLEEEFDLPAYLLNWSEGSCGGLVNQGNTCYQNAVLQALVKTIFKEELVGDLVPVNDDQLKVDFCNTINALNDIDKTSAYNPREFASSVFNSFFNGYQGQQDAAEFLEYLLNYLFKTFDCPLSLPHFEFTITMLNTRQCLNGHISHKADPLSSVIQLCFSDDNNNPTIDDLFNDVVSEQVLPDFNCSQCQQVVKKRDQYIIPDEQKFLILQLKRFGFDQTNMVLTKNNTPLSIHASGIISIPCVEGKKVNFKVAAIVVHRGENADSGHYFTVCADGIYNDEEIILDGGAAMEELLFTGSYNEAQGYLYFLERVEDAPLAIENELEIIDEETYLDQEVVTQEKTKKRKKRDLDLLNSYKTQKKKTIKRKDYLL